MKVFVGGGIDPSAAWQPLSLQAMVAIEGDCMRGCEWKGL